MKFNLGQIEILKQALSDQFWCGKRWATLNSVKSTIELSGINCFDDYSKAVEFCYQKNNRIKYWRVFLLADVLKLLNGKNVQPLPPKNKRSLFDLISYYPVTIESDPNLFYHFEGNCLFPIIWNKVINPLSCIETFSIFLIKKKKNRNCRYFQTNPKIDSEIPFFTTAVERFDEVCKNQSSFYHAIALVGQFKNKKVEVDNNGIPLRNTGIALLVSKSKKSKKERNLFQLNDPLSLLKIPVAMFAKYNVEKNQLHFYDGAMRKILPGKQIQFMDLEYYSSVLELA